MSMCFIGIDISKYKHDCCIISAADQKVVSKFSFKNDKNGFESTAYYALNLELFLENAHHSFMEVNPVLIKEYIMILEQNPTVEEW